MPSASQLLPNRLAAAALSAAIALLAGCANGAMDSGSPAMVGADGADTQGPDFPRQDGDAGAGRTQCGPGS